MTLSDLDDFLEDGTRAENTIRSYRYVLARFLGWVEAEQIDFSTLKPASVKGWLRSQGWGVNLSYMAATAIRVFARWKSGASHPLASFRVRREETPPQRTLTQEQAARLLEVLKDLSGGRRYPLESARNLAIVALMLDTGLRASEVCRLSLNYLSLETRSLTVRAKGGKWKTCTFSDETADFLQDWLSRRGDQQAGGAAVFIGIQGSTPGGPLTTGGLRAIFRGIGKRAGLAAFSPHDLRRSFATLSIQNGAPTRMVQRQGGWASLQLVERYTAALNAQAFRVYSPVSKIAPKAEPASRPEPAGVVVIQSKAGRSIYHRMKKPGA